MKRIRLLLPASALFCLVCVALYGCTSSTFDNDEELVPRKKAATVELRKEIVYKEVGTITGTVTFDGPPPGRPRIAAIDDFNDAKGKAECLKGDISDPTWMVNPANGGVENVVVYVSVPRGFYFKKPEAQHKAWADTVEIDQPYCAFEPHVQVLYPQYYDGKQLVSTEQLFVVKNSANIGHNIKMAGNPDVFGGVNESLSSKSAKTFNQSIKDMIPVDPQPLTVNCDIHKWMKGYVLTFDHPYAVRTDKDGKFTIKNVPAGVDLRFEGWHEALKRFPIEGGAKVNLKPNETKTLDFKVKK